MASRLIRRDEANVKDFERCHDGEGTLRCHEYLGDYHLEHGFAFLHDLEVPPGATIGEHTHERDEEMYVILEGRGRMRIDGVEHQVAGGDLMLTRVGGSHSLVNDGEEPMRVLVICARVGG